MTCTDAVELQRAMRTSRERYLACAFLLQAENRKFGGLVEDLENAQAVGRQEYPKTMSDALYLFDNWKGTARKVTTTVVNDTEAMTF